MCEKTNVLYSCGCHATVIDFCTLVKNNPAAPCPIVRNFTGNDLGICPSCTDKSKEKLRKEGKKKGKGEGSRGREQHAKEETSRDLIRAQAFAAGYNDAWSLQEVRAQAFAAGYEDERRRQESAGISYDAGYGYGTANSYGATYAETYEGSAAEDAYRAELQYAQGVVEENQRMGQGRSSRERWR
jgi:hypothetical protein